MNNSQFQYDVVFYLPALAPLLATNDIGATGGAETQIFLIARALAAQGLRVCLCTFDAPGADIPGHITGVDVILRSPYTRAGVRARLREAVSLVQDLSRIESEVYVTRIAGFHVGLVAIAARLRGRRFVFSTANVDDFAFRDYSPPLRDWVLHQLGMRLAATLIVQTEEQRDRCGQLLRRSATVVPNIVELAEPARRPGDSFLWIGRAVWYKDPLKYVELARALPDAVFVAVCAPGTGGDEDLSGKLAEAAAPVSNLTLLTGRSRGKLLPLIDRAVAVVNTSVAEGMSNATLEGWARGVPALTLAHDPDGLIRRHRLGAFAAGSWPTFVDQARELWSSREEQSDLSGRCRAYVREVHSEQRVSAMWTNLLFGEVERPLTTAQGRV